MARGSRFARVGGASIAFASLMAMAGCAHVDIHRETETAGATSSYGPPQRRVCETISGPSEPSWYGERSEDQWTDRGSQFFVCTSNDTSSGGPGPAEGGLPSLSEARQAALENAYRGAFERLASRGIVYDEGRLETMVTERAQMRALGESVDFPRIEVADSVDEVCRGLDGSHKTYRSTLLAEYPIANLRGDVNNASWHARRAVNEAGVLMVSADELLGEGRWFDALLELRAARDVLDGAAAGPEVRATVEQVEKMERQASWALSVEPLDGVKVLEAGERRLVVVRFRWTCEWGEGAAPAVRVPVSFVPEGFDGIFANDPETDESGAAACRIVVAFGLPGEYAVRAGLALGVLASALGDTFAGIPTTGVDAVTRIFLAEGAHAISTCIEVEGLDAEDQAQFVAGFERRMERDGFSVAPCGPDADIVVRVDARKGTPELYGETYRTEVTVAAVVFDQRSATELGAPEIKADEMAPDARGSEVVSLKEAGRLLAAYLERLALLSGD